MNNQNQPTDILTGERSLPNATAVLVLGILSIVFCFICGIVAMILSNGDRKLYHANPGVYSDSSYELMKAGRVCAIIGLAIWGVVLLIYMVILMFALSFAFLK